MATQTNVLKLPRFSRTIQLKKKNSSVFDGSETLKLAAMNSINLSVKFNNVSFVTGQDLNKLPKEPNQPENIEQESAHHNLMTMRKKYDNMNKFRSQKEHEVQILQQQRNKLKSMENNFTNGKTEGQQNVGQLNSDLENIKLELQQAEIEKKIMSNMIDRLKSDKIVYDLRRYDMEKKLELIQKKKLLIQKQMANRHEQEDRTKKVYGKLIKQIEGQSMQRNTHMYNMVSMKNEKIQNLQNNLVRQRQMADIAETTLQSKDVKEKNWYNVYLCHRFVQKLLRDKMHSQMVKFNTVQVAFKNIKTSTGVTNSETFISKFLNKQNAYGQLLGQIAENQRKIIEYKAENESLNKQRKKLLDEQDALNSNRREKLETSREEKELHLVNEKIERCRLYEEKLKTWISRNIKKFGSIDGKSTDVKQKKTLTGVFEQFKSFLRLLIQEQSKQGEVENLPFSTEGIPLNKNCRIKLDKLRENGVQIYEEQIQNLNQDDDFLNSQRVEVIRTNEKFMNMLKKKYEQIKKAKLEAQPKKPVVVQKPKPPVTAQI